MTTHCTISNHSSNSTRILNLQNTSVDITLHLSATGTWSWSKMDTNLLLLRALSLPQLPQLIGQSEIPVPQLRIWMVRPQCAKVLFSHFRTKVQMLLQKPQTRQAACCKLGNNKRRENPLHSNQDKVKRTVHSTIGIKLLSKRNKTNKSGPEVQHNTKVCSIKFKE